VIILDTNIISELMKPEPNSSVSSWIDQQIITKVFLTAITIAEINYGIQVLPGGKRQQELEQSFEKTIMSIFQYRILSFDCCYFFNTQCKISNKKYPGFCRMWYRTY
jgi:predicted nucleic acid-binding protein